MLVEIVIFRLKIVISLLILPTSRWLLSIFTDFRTLFPPFSLLGVERCCMFNAVAAANNLKWCKENLLMIEWKKPRLIEPIQSPRGALLFFRLHPLALSSAASLLYIYQSAEQQILNWAWKVFFVLHTSLLICRPQTPINRAARPSSVQLPLRESEKVLIRRKNENWNENVWERPCLHP